MSFYKAIAVSLWAVPLILLILFCDGFWDFFKFAVGCCLAGAATWGLCELTVYLWLLGSAT